jgi:hypothetical protein
LEDQISLCLLTALLLHCIQLCSLSSPWETSYKLMWTVQFSDLWNILKLSDLAREWVFLCLGFYDLLETNWVWLQVFVPVGAVVMALAQLMECVIVSWVIPELIAPQVCFCILECTCMHGNWYSDIDLNSKHQ